MKWLLRGLPGAPAAPAADGRHDRRLHARDGDGRALRLGVSEENTATVWWLALVAGLIVTVPTALTGFADWLDISRGTPLWRTATAHLTAMLSGDGRVRHRSRSGARRLRGRRRRRRLARPDADRVRRAGLGGWLGGAIVFVHGMRVLNLVEEPTARAISPVPSPEKEEAEGA